MGQAPLVWRLGPLVVGAAVAVALGLSLLAGDRDASQIESQAVLSLFTPANARAFVACPPALLPETQTGTTITEHGGVTTYTSHGEAQGLSGRQLLRKADCLRRQGLISSRTLAAVRDEASATHSNDLVPWWAPTAIVPTWPTVLFWSLILGGELLGLLALVTPSRRKQPSIEAG